MRKGDAETGARELVRAEQLAREAPRGFPYGIGNGIGLGSRRFTLILDGDRLALYRPARIMPAHDSHTAAGAEFKDFGWKRPDWYRVNGGDREAAVTAEMLAVRNASVLGLGWQ